MPESWTFAGNKIVGTSMDGRMTKELVIAELRMPSAIQRLQRAVFCIPTAEASIVPWIIRYSQKNMDLSAA